MGSRSGQTLVESLLIATVVMVAVIVAAYVKMPEFERGVHAIARDIGGLW